MQAPRRVISLFLLLFLYVFVIPSFAQVDLPEIIKRIEPSIVSITTYNKAGKELATGSGFFVEKDGDVLTSLHVLDKAWRAEIKISNGDIFQITNVLAEDSAWDLIRVAVNIPREKVKPLVVNKSLPQIGEKVIVMGSPLGLEKTVSDGIVSAIREIQALGKIIQFTAPVSPGSSGSPVINMKGQVIGIVSFQSDRGQNLNFAIPGVRLSKLSRGNGKELSQWSASKEKEWLALVEKVYHLGNFYLANEEYEKALATFEKVYEFEKVVPNKPRYAYAYSQIGFCHGKLGNWSQALEPLQKAIMLKPDFAEPYHNIGYIFIGMKKYEEGIKLINHAIEMEPDNPEVHIAYNNLGYAYLNLKQYDKAINFINLSIKISPDYPGAYLYLGLTYIALGRHNEAIREVKRALLLRPNLASAHGVLAAAYFSVNLYSEAIDACNRAINLTPNDAGLYYVLGNSLFRQGHHEQGIEAFKKAIEVNPDFEASYDALGVAYLNLGRYPEMIDVLKQVIRRSPESPQAHYNLGLFYLKLGDKKSSLDEYTILKGLNADLANKLFNQIYK